MGPKGCDFVAGPLTRGEGLSSGACLQMQLRCACAALSNAAAARHALVVQLHGS